MSAVIQSGIATTDPSLAWPNVDRKTKGGKTINIPFWNRLVDDTDDTDDEVLSDSTALTVNPLSSGESAAVIHARGKAWGANDLAGYFAGSDPIRAIADMVAEYWTVKQQKLLIKTLKGVFAAATMADSVNNISAKSGSDGLISSNAMIDTIYKIGDANEKISGVMMHSEVMRKLAELNLISTIRDADGKVLYKAYLEKRVIMDDALAPDTITVDSASKKAYPIYFFGQGAIAFNEDTTGLETETDRDILAGDSVMTSRRFFTMHPRGISWTGTAAGVTPSNTELATGTNWKLADVRKNVAITKLIARVD
jgi:hypothetical protein